MNPRSALNIKWTEWGNFMEFFKSCVGVLLFCAACNLDTIILAMSYSAKGFRISRLHGLVIAAVTTLVTWLSMLLGDVASVVLPSSLADLFGGMLLLGIGLWFILDWLRSMEKDASEDESENGAMSFWVCVSLAASLAVNNAGIGVAAGVASIGLGKAAVGNFIVTLAFLAVGNHAGSCIRGERAGKLMLPLSGLLLIVLGIGEAFF